MLALRHTWGHRLVVTWLTSALRGVAARDFPQVFGPSETAWLQPWASPIAVSFGPQHCTKGFNFSSLAAGDSVDLTYVVEGGVVQHYWHRGRKLGDARIASVAGHMMGLVPLGFAVANRSPG